MAGSGSVLTSSPQPPVTPPSTSVYHPGDIIPPPLSAQLSLKLMLHHVCHHKCDNHFYSKIALCWCVFLTHKMCINWQRPNFQTQYNSNLRKKCTFNGTNLRIAAVDLAQLTEPLLPTSEYPGSNPVINYFVWKTVIT